MSVVLRVSLVILIFSYHSFLAQAHRPQVPRVWEVVMGDSDGEFEVPSVEEIVLWCLSPRGGERKRVELLLQHLVHIMLVLPTIPERASVLTGTSIVLPVLFASTFSYSS